MKSINRIAVVLVFWASALAFCVFVSTNVYLNAFLICTGFISALLACGYIFDKGMNEKEKRFMQKGMKVLGFE